jgi:hypothetical protein
MKPAEIVKMIREFKRQRIHEIMVECKTDEQYALKFNIPLETWISYCKPNGPVPEGCDIRPDFLKQDCTTDHIHSLGPCIEQCLSIHKLRELISHFVENKQ